MLSDDELKAAAKTALELATACARYRSNANILANLRPPAPSASVPKLPVVPPEPPYPLTRAEIADYLELAGWNPDKARELSDAEHALDFGHRLTSKHLQVFADLVDNAPEQDRATLLLQTVDLLARWLLRKRQAVGPDDRIVVGVRGWGEAKKIVAAWISDEFASQKVSKLDETEALDPAAWAQRRRTRASSQERKPKTNTRSGRPPRLAADFVACAAELWLTIPRRNPRARSDTKAQLKATDNELRAIAARLDREGYVPPADYLERKAAEELKRYNSRNSNSKVGVIKTWSQLVSLADKDHLRGMRRLLSRCAEKVSSELPSPVRK